MSSSRRRLGRRSLSSPRWSMAHSLSICGIGQGAAHLVRPLELEPVAGAFQDDEPVVTFDVAGGGLGAALAESRILVAPKEDGRHFDGADVRQPLPGAATGCEVGAVVVEGGRQAARAGKRAGEMVD